MIAHPAIIAAASMLYSIAAVVAAEPLTALVIEIRDGDTFACEDASGARHVVRLAGIDAPELQQAYGQGARRHIAIWTLARDVSIQPAGRDQSGAIVAHVTVEGEHVNARMAADGFAWSLGSDPVLDDAMDAARTAGRGLWADAKPVPPWKWRAPDRERKRQPAAR